MTLDGFASLAAQASLVTCATASPLVRASCTTEAESPGTCRVAIFGSGPSALPIATTGMPAAIAASAHFISGGPATGRSAKALNRFDAIASLQLAISLGTL